MRILVIFSTTLLLFGVASGYSQIDSTMTKKAGKKLTKDLKLPPYGKIKWEELYFTTEEAYTSGRSAAIQKIESNGTTRRALGYSTYSISNIVGSTGYAWTAKVWKYRFTHKGIVYYGTYYGGKKRLSCGRGIQRTMYEHERR